MEKKHSGFGIASFIASLVVGLLIFLTLVIAGILEMRSSGGMDEKAPATIIIGFAVIGFMMLDLLAVVLGIVGLCQKDTKKVFAILGIILSSLTLLGTLGLIIIGNVMK